MWLCVCGEVRRVLGGSETGGSNLTAQTQRTEGEQVRGGREMERKWIFARVKDRQAQSK